MPQWVIASVFGVLAFAAVWGICASLSTGVARDEVWEFAIDKSPVGFVVVLLGKFLVFCFCVAVVLHAAGIPAADPIAATRQMLPFLSDPPGR